MRMPIPQDWDNQSWCCVVIEWPYSPLYMAILYGQLTALSLGRFWDPDTGSLLQAMAVGEEINNRNDDEGCNVTCLDDIVQALNDLSISVSVSSSSSGGTACCPGGRTPGTVSGEEGQPAPEKFSDPPSPVGTPPYYTRKCKVSNYTHEQIKSWVQAIIDAGIEPFVNATGFAGVTAATTLLGYVLGELTTPFPLIDGLAGGVIGFLYGIINQMLEGGLDLSAMLADLQTDEEGYICALYEATTGDEAIVNYLDQANTVGMSPANQALLGAMMVVDYVNTIFFTPEQSGSAFEAFLDGYTPPVSCDSCSQCGSGAPCAKTWDFASGVDGWVFTDQTTGDGDFAGSWNPVGVLNIVGTYNSGTVNGAGVWSYDLTGLNVCVQPGDTLEYTVTKLCPGSFPFNQNVSIVYDDDTYDVATQLLDDTSPHTIQVVATKSGIIKQLNLQITATNVGPNACSWAIDDAQIDLAQSPNCPF